MTQNQAPYGSQPPGPGPKQLRRSQTDRKISGVCGGIAEYLDVDANLVRILVVLGTIVTGGGLALAYVVAVIIMPDGTAPPMWNRGYSAPGPASTYQQPPYAQAPPATPQPQPHPAPPATPQPTPVTPQPPAAASDQRTDGTSS